MKVINEKDFNEINKIDVVKEIILLFEPFLWL
jgi:hypothetical protein